MGFNNIINRVNSIYPGCSIEVSNEHEYQIAIIEIKSGLFKSPKRIKITYRQRAKPSWQIQEDEQSDLARNISGLYGYVSSLPAKNQKVKALFLRKILTLNTEFSIIEERGEIKEMKTLIQTLAQDFDTFLFVQPNTTISKSPGQHFLDKDLNLILDRDGNCEINSLDVKIDTDYVDLEKHKPTADQIERKQKTEVYLDNRNIKINRLLPCIESENEITIRLTKEIAERVSVLAITNMVAFNGITGEEAIEQLKENNLWDKTTPNEKRFLADPTAEKKIAETWKCEAIWVLLWALKKVDDLGDFDKLCDLNNIPSNEYPVSHDMCLTNFIAQIAKSRIKDEILNANDLYYRLNWACVDARINNETVGELNASVIYERHYALNWLINYMGQEWDDISCDT